MPTRHNVVSFQTKRSAYAIWGVLSDPSVLVGGAGGVSGAKLEPGTTVREWVRYTQEMIEAFEIISVEPERRLVLKANSAFYGLQLVEITLVPLASATRIELAIRLANGQSRNARFTGWDSRLKRLFPPSGRG